MAGVLGVIMIAGCAVGPTPVRLPGVEGELLPGDIVDLKSGRRLSFEALIDDLAGVPVVFVGERHVDAAHHDVQRRIIEALLERHPQLTVGMEMFDRTYQAVLDQWTAGQLSEAEFLRRTHWRVNWRYDFGLYRELLDLVRTRRLRLLALNLPFHIPPKIAAGGLDSLTPADRAHLPRDIDLGNASHRERVKAVFAKHPFGGERRFEDFYAAQCVWEDTMAESITAGRSQAPIVALMGSGHIRTHTGVPDRTARRLEIPFRSVLPLSAGEPIQRDDAHYVFLTPPSPRSGRGIRAP